MMTLRGEPLPWQINSDDSYVQISHEGTVVGMIKADYASKLVEILNEDQVMRKAVQYACADLLRQAGKDVGHAETLMKQYVAKAQRPRSGTPAIATLLRDRQAELGVKDAEFVQFCNINRLSPEWLKDIYGGDTIPDRLLGPLAKILGTTVEHLMQVRDGKS